MACHPTPYYCMKTNITTLFLAFSLLFFPAVVFGQPDGSGGYTIPDPPLEPPPPPDQLPDTTSVYVDLSDPWAVASLCSSGGPCIDPASVQPGDFFVVVSGPNGELATYVCGSTGIACPPTGGSGGGSNGPACTPSPESCGACTAQQGGDEDEEGAFTQTCTDGCSNYTKPCLIPPPTLTFTGTYAGSTPPQIAPPLSTLILPKSGGTVTLNWSTVNTNPGRCTASSVPPRFASDNASGWSGNRNPTSGTSIQSPITVNTIFSLECFNTSVDPRVSTGKKSVVVNLCSPTGVKTYGECSALCGGGTRTVTDSCGKVSNESCNTQACNSCTPTPDCKANQVCIGTQYDVSDNCGGTATCQGTRSCDYNWKEIAP